MEPISSDAPAAPWSVPEPFSAGRRPNSLHTWTITRSASGTPFSSRPSRSAWNALQRLGELRQVGVSVAAWFSCVS